MDHRFALLVFGARGVEFFLIEQLIEKCGGEGALSLEMQLNVLP